ncbi:MAG: flagellar biosynthesis protein FlhA [Phycisphaerales bacterium]
MAKGQVQSSVAAAPARPPAGGSRPAQAAGPSARTLRPAGSGFNPVELVRRYRGLILPFSFVALLIVVIVPIPPAAMDMLICLNISLSVVILMTTIYMKEPLEFSVFPSLLLATTLFRLVLNVASTRLVLSAEARSPDEALHVAGEVIMAFGTFVAGQSLYVGAVIFIILIIVQFVVITKGATRISEVAARFTLDAMPGKQLAIDADLNAGIINEQEARRRRERIGQEADFFGAMDGASKFVRGDAIAGIIITAVNVLGGIAVGTLDKGWPVMQSVDTFTKLTIGDGLTAQIPSFIIAIASALIVTRSGSKAQLGDELTGQLSSQPTGLWVTSGFLAIVAFTGLPTIPLLGTSLVLATLALTLTRAARQTARQQQQETLAGAAKPAQPDPEQLLKLDTIELEVGYGLVSLVDEKQGGDLLSRISAIRRQLTVELGLIMPPVRIRDNLQLGATDYRLKIKGAVVARGTTIPGKLLAIDPGVASGPIEGLPAKEPAFGLDGRWIDPALKTKAETLNYTVVDPSSVLATHLTEVVRTHAADLLTRQEVTELVAQLKTKAPKLVEEVVPGAVKTGDLHRVLQNLLRERVPIRDLETILETLADWSSKTKDLDVLTEYVRNALRRSICQQYATPPAPGDPPSARPKIVCVALDPALEDLVSGYIDRGAAGTSLNMPAPVAAAVAQRIVEGLGKVTASGHQPVVIASPPVRGVVRQLIEPHLPAAAVLGYNEVASGVDLESLAMIAPPSAEDAKDQAAAA